MDAKIKVSLEFTISGSGLEDAFEEYDELTVVGMLSELIDKSIAVDDVKVQLLEGPNTLEDYDAISDS